MIHAIKKHIMAHYDEPEYWGMGFLRYERIRECELVRGELVRGMGPGNTEK